MTNTAATPSATDVRVFVPSKDHELSRRFYLALGCKENWRHEKLSELELGGVRVFLQDFYAKDWAENFMMYITVDDPAAWHDHVQRLIDTGDYPGVRVQSPRKEDHGDTVTYVHDPCGVLLHLAQPG